MYDHKKTTLSVGFIEHFYVTNGYTPDRLALAYMWCHLCAKNLSKAIN